MVSVRNSVEVPFRPWGRLGAPLSAVVNSLKAPDYRRSSPIGTTLAADLSLIASPQD
nr:MAG TPA: hypothetical protein [Caudoviricetes sp.]